MSDKAPAPSAGSPAAAPPATDPLLTEAEDHVRNAALDLDWSLAEVYTSNSLPPDEAALVQAAVRGWVVHVQLNRTSNNGIRLRVTTVAPGSQRLGVIVTAAAASELQLALAKLLRQLDPTRKQAAPIRQPAAASAVAVSAHPAGAAILGGTSAILGGYFGYALESAAGSEDARLIFPLMAIGAGLGFSASLVVAEEWNVSTETAWYLTAGAMWAPLSALLIVSAADPDVRSIHIIGPPAAALGIGLTAWLASTQEISPASALFTHYGSLLGTVAGSLTESLIDGEASLSTPLGAGIGAGVGLLTFAAIAPALRDVETQTVLYSGIGSLLGGLTGAALASPVLVGKTIEPKEQRIWLGSVLLGMTGGAVAGFFFGHSRPQGSAAAWKVTPTVVPIFRSQDFLRSSTRRPIVIPGAIFTF